MRAAAHARGARRCGNDARGPAQLLGAACPTRSSGCRGSPRPARASFLRARRRPRGRRRSSPAASSATGTRSSSLLYAECRPADATRQLEQAERWLREHSQDATLLHALGVLCERQQLWGKAQTYLEASLALDDAWRTHVALGELLARLGRDGEANAHLAAALKLALAELAANRVGRGRRFEARCSVAQSRCQALRRRRLRVCGA